MSTDVSSRQSAVGSVGATAGPTRLGPGAVWYHTGLVSF
jgi:hypothetical protein